MPGLHDPVHRKDSIAMMSLPSYDRWLTTPPEDHHACPVCPICEVELDRDNTCACGEYCVECCPDCEKVHTCESCGMKLTVEVPACECGRLHCTYCHESEEE